MSRPSVPAIVRQVCHAICEHMRPQLICLPKTEEEVKEKVENFFDRWLFRQYLGAVDCVGGPVVPPDQLSTWTRGPRTGCPPGRVVLGPYVPHQDRISPTPFNAQVSVKHFDWCQKWRDGVV